MTAKTLLLGLATVAGVSPFASVTAVAQEAATLRLTGPRVELTQAFRVGSPGGDSGATLQAVGRKDPLVAGVLSFFVPGLGSFYAGNKGHGVRHLAIGVAGAVLYVSGTDCTPPSGDIYGTCSYSSAALVCENSVTVVGGHRTAGWVGTAGSTRGAGRRAGRCSLEGARSSARAPSWRQSTPLPGWNP